MTTRLEYQPDAPARRRTRRWRRSLLAALVIGFGALAVWLGPSTYRAALRTYWERRVKAYAAPPDRVVYEEDPSRWPALLAQPEYLRMPTSWGWNAYVVYVAPPVTRFANAAEVNVRGSVLFAHARRTPSGRERLVLVWLPYGSNRPDANGASPDNQVRISLATSIVTGTKHYSNTIYPWIAPQTVAEDPQGPLHARLFAGQVDPDDASHFTIRFQIGDYEDVLDGYLRDDDTVLIRPRKLDHPLNPK